MNSGQNVIHETGFSKARLGFSKAYCLMSSTEESLNLHGIHTKFVFQKECSRNVRRCCGDN